MSTSNQAFILQDCMHQTFKAAFNSDGYIKVLPNRSLKQKFHVPVEHYIPISYSSNTTYM